MCQWRSAGRGQQPNVLPCTASLLDCILASVLTFNAVQPRILLILSLVLNVGARRVKEALLHAVERNSRASGSENEAKVESSLPASTHSQHHPARH